MVVKNEPEVPIDTKNNKRMLEACLVFSSKVAPDIFNNVKLTCKRSPHKIWERLKTNYATASIYGIYRVWTNFTQVPYKNDLLRFITKIEKVLAKIHMISLETKKNV